MLPNLHEKVPHCNHHNDNFVDGESVVNLQTENQHFEMADKSQYVIQDELPINSNIDDPEDEETDAYADYLSSRFCLMLVSTTH